MKATAIFFGQLKDITQTSALDISGIADTDGILQELYSRFPALESAKFILAVNDDLVEKNTALAENSVVALMPPFSGG